MNKSMLLILAVVLASCGKPEPTETVESLVGLNVSNYELV